MRVLFKGRHFRSALLLVLVVGFVIAIQVVPAFAGAQTVTTNTDEDIANGATSCSLREAIKAANTNTNYHSCGAGTAGTDTISFAAATNGTPFTLTLGALPAITGSTAFAGNGQLNTVVQAAATAGTAAFNVFTSTSVSAMSFNGMTIQNGGDGATVTNGGCLAYTGTGGGNLTNVLLQNCKATGNGGAVFIGSSGAMSIFQSEFTTNTATNGGAVYAGGGANVQVSGDSYFHDNTATTGGAFYNDVGSNIFGQTISIIHNSATTASAYYAAAGSQQAACLGCCIVFNSTYAVQNDGAAFGANFTNTWWGVEYGPGADPQPTINGDTIVVPGGGPNVSWVPHSTTKPAGITPSNCFGCAATSNIVGARVCSAAITGLDP